MDLQNLFYIVSIIFMLTVVTLVIAGALIVYYIRKKIFQLTKIASRPKDAAVEIGVGIVDGMGLKIKDWFTPKRK